MNIVESSHERRDGPVDGRSETENFPFEVGSHTHLPFICHQYADTFPGGLMLQSPGLSSLPRLQVLSPYNSIFFASSFQNPTLFIRSWWIQPSPPTDTYLLNRGVPSLAADAALGGNHVLDPA